MRTNCPPGIGSSGASSTAASLTFAVVPPARLPSPQPSARTPTVASNAGILSLPSSRPENTAERAFRQAVRGRGQAALRAARGLAAPGARDVVEGHALDGDVHLAARDVLHEGGVLALEHLGRDQEIRVAEQLEPL